MDTSVPLHFLEFVSFSRVYFVAIKQQLSAGEVPTPLGGIWKYGDVFRAMAQLGSGTVAFSGLGAKDPRCSVVPGPAPYSEAWYHILDGFWIALWIFRWVNILFILTQSLFYMYIQSVCVCCCDIY